MESNCWKTLPQGIAAALLILIAGYQLNAAPKPKPAAKEDVNKKAPVLTASSAVPQFPVPAISGCPDNASCSNAAVLEKQMVELVNADRLDPANQAETAGREMPLRWDSRLAQAARVHSEIMASRHALSHNDPNGDSPVERVYRAGVQWVAMGENIAANFTVAAAEAALMNEPRFQPNHRGNILSKKYNAMGIGIVHGADGRVYITQDFAEEP